RAAGIYQATARPTSGSSRRLVALCDERGLPARFSRLRCDKTPHSPLGTALSAQPGLCLAVVVLTSTERLVETNGVQLRVIDAGDRDAPVVVLAHGFPELAYSWRHQIPALAEAGYRV